MSMYHVAKFEFKEGDILKTHVPHHLIKYEGDIPRICVSNHPLKCILALHPVLLIKVKYIIKRTPLFITGYMIGFIIKGILL